MVLLGSVGTDGLKVFANLKAMYGIPAGRFCFVAQGRGCCSQSRLELWDCALLTVCSPACPNPIPVMENTGVCSKPSLGRVAKHHREVWRHGWSIPMPSLAVLVPLSAPWPPLGGQGMQQNSELELSRETKITPSSSVAMRVEMTLWNWTIVLNSSDITLEMGGVG